MEADRDDLNRRLTEIGDWWHKKADQEIRATVDKALEYGSHDLVMIGQELLYGLRQDGPRTSEQFTDRASAAELGVFFYLLGKMARWVSAIREGQQVSPDTLVDIGIYVRMAQRIRETGQWP